MFSKFSVFPRVSIYLKGSKRLLHMSKKFACANMTNRQIYRQGGLNIQDDQPICSGSRYSLGGATMQMRPMSSTDSKDGDFDKSKERTSDLKTDNKYPTTDNKVVNKVFRRKSRKESRESLKKGDRFKFSSKRRRNQRDLTFVPIVVKAKKETGLKFPHQKVADLLKNNEKHKGIDILRNVGISQSTLPPKKLHVEYIESINMKDIELKKNPSSSIEKFKPNSDTKGVKRNKKLASEATQLTNLYLESKNRVPIQMEKASNDTNSSPKDTQTKPPVVGKTFNNEIQMLPLNTGNKLDTPQKIEDAEKKNNKDKYKPLGLRYTKFSKLKDRAASVNIKSHKSHENPVAGHTTPQQKPKVEKLNFPEMLKPNSLNTTPVSENEPEKLLFAMTQEVKSAKHKNATTLQKLPEIYKTPSLENTADSTAVKHEPLPVVQELETRNPHSNKSTLKEQSNSEFLKVSEILKSTDNFEETYESLTETKNILNSIPKDAKPKSEVEPSKVLQNEKSKELNRTLNITHQMNNEIKVDSPLTPITSNSENQPESNQWRNATDEPNFRLIVNLDSISPMDKQSNTKPSGSNDTKSPPKDTQTKPPVVIKTFKNKIQMLPLNAGKKVDTPQKAEDGKKKNTLAKYKPLGLRYTKFSKLMDRIASGKIKSHKSHENPLTGHHTTPRQKPEVEKLNFSEILKPTSLNTTPASEIEAENLSFETAKLPTNTTTLQKQSNSDIFQLPKIYKTTSFKNTLDSTQIKNESLPVAQELETANSHSNLSTLKEKSNSDVLKLSEKFKSSSNFDITYEPVKETTNTFNSIVKDVNPKSELEHSTILQNEKSKELNHMYNRTHQKNNEIKLDSPLTPITSNSDIKLTVDQDIKIIITDTSKSLNTSVNSVDTKLEIPPTPTYTNVKAKIEQTNNELRLDDTKSTLTESLPRTTITNRTVKTTKSGVFNYKTKRFHSKHSAHEELKKIKPKFISKYKRVEMFKKATEKILGRLESAKSKMGPKDDLTNDLKTLAFKTMSAILDNQATEKSAKKATEKIVGPLEPTKLKIGQKADLPTSIVNDLKTTAFENRSSKQENQSPEKSLQLNSKSPKDVEITNTSDKLNIPDFKLKNLALVPSESNSISNIDAHGTKPKPVAANSDKYKLLPKLDTDILKVKKVPKTLENDIKIAKEGAAITDLGNISPPSLENIKAKISPMYQSLNVAKNKNLTKSDQGNTPPNSQPTKQINKFLYMVKNKNSTKSEPGNIPAPSVDTLDPKNSSSPNQSMNMAKNNKVTKSDQGNIPPPSVNNLEAKNSTLANQSLNMAKDKSSTKIDPGNIPQPFVTNLKANNPPLPNQINQSLNTAENKNSIRSEKATKEADDTRIWTTLPRAQVVDNSKNRTNSPQNIQDSSLKRLKLPKTNVDLPSSNFKTVRKSDELNFSTTDIKSKSKLVEPMKQPLTDVGKGNEGTYKPSNTIKENASKSSNMGEDASNPVTGVSLDKYESPSQYPKNMFGETITREQLRKSQDKLRAFQTNLDVTTARPSPEKISNQHSATANTKRPDKVSRPGPSKKPGSDGGSGNEGGENSGGSEAIHDTRGHIANFWSSVTITTLYLTLSFMIYLMKDLPPLNPWQQFFTSLTREQTEAILRIQKAAYEKDMINSDLRDSTDEDLLPENIVTESNENEDQNNSKMVEFDKNSKFEDV